MNPQISSRTKTLLKLSLACAFLANGITAIVAPSEFGDLVSGSFLNSLFSVAVFLKIIAVNDILLGVLILFSPKWRKAIMAWAMVWVVGVMVVVGEPLDILEHFSFFFLALALYLNESNK